MTITIKYLDEYSEEVKSTRGRVIGILREGGLMPQKLVLIEGNHGDVLIQERLIVDKEILEGALTV